MELLLLISVASRFHSRNSTDEFKETLADFDHRFLTVVQHFLQTHKALKAVMPLPGGCSLSSANWDSSPCCLNADAMLKSIFICFPDRGLNWASHMDRETFHGCGNGLIHCPVCPSLNPRLLWVLCCLFWQPFADSPLHAIYGMHTQYSGSHSKVGCLLP